MLETAELKDHHLAVWLSDGFYLDIIDSEYLTKASDMNNNNSSLSKNRTFCIYCSDEESI